jgi:hypothetical protein
VHFLSLESRETLVRFFLLSLAFRSACRGCAMPPRGDAQGKSPRGSSARSFASSSRCGHNVRTRNVVELCASPTSSRGVRVGSSFALLAVFLPCFHYLRAMWLVHCAPVPHFLIMFFCYALVARRDSWCHLVCSWRRSPVARHRPRASPKNNYFVRLVIQTHLHIVFTFWGNRF